MSTINQKMGLKPKSRARAATHGSSLVSSAQCPECRGWHVIENVIHGVRKRMCGACGHIWKEETHAQS